MPPSPEPTTDLSRFTTLLRKIVVDETGSEPAERVVEQIREISSTPVPDWIMTLFQSLSDREPLPIQEQPEPTTDADITESEFFADLEDVEAFDCYDFGEWVRIRLPRHGMLGFFSRQFAYFTTARLDQVLDDAKSDISEAKILDR
jgi:hypothetical protein